MDDKKKILYITSRHSISPTGCWRVHDDFVISSKIFSIFMRLFGTSERQENGGDV